MSTEKITEARKQQTRDEILRAVLRQDDDKMRDAMKLAIGLGGWEVDDSDPFKRPYSPRSAALTAAERFEITDELAIAFLESAVRTQRDNDAEQRALRAKQIDAKEMLDDMRENDPEWLDCDTRHREGRDS